MKKSTLIRIARRHFYRWLERDRKAKNFSGAKHWRRRLGRYGK